MLSAAAHDSSTGSVQRCYCKPSYFAGSAGIHVSVIPSAVSVQTILTQGITAYGFSLALGADPQDRLLR
ncbi:hypothetical protein EV681_0828 [Advenella incenata]|uniref:Uncharacterized protein n=1 Tax=Advenella incenata TaxID=267800 RepID=A0A4Q7VRC0_9BURK|nr:hypothetical protein EV681_0828 [Advenella incenata]